MKIGVNINEEVLKKIDKKAEEMGISRSAFLTMCAANYLKQDEILEQMPEMLGALKKIEQVVKENSGAQRLEWSASNPISREDCEGA